MANDVRPNHPQRVVKICGVPGGFKEIETLGVSKKKRVILPPKWMVKNNGKPNEQMDDLRGFPIIFGLTPIW